MHPSAAIANRYAPIPVVESVSQFKARLKREGNWQSFRKGRKKRMDKGTPGMIAFRNEAMKYPAPPTDGSAGPTPSKSMSIEEADAQWERLHSLCVGKKATELDVMRWVSDNLHRPIQTITEVPSPSAANWLRHLLDNPDQQGKFWDQYTKLLPSKAQLDNDAGKLADDGRPVLATLDRISRLMNLGGPPLNAAGESA